MTPLILLALLPSLSLAATDVWAGLCTDLSQTVALAQPHSPHAGSRRQTTPRCGVKDVVTQADLLEDLVVGMTPNAGPAGADGRKALACIQRLKRKLASFSHHCSRLSLRHTRTSAHGRRCMRKVKHARKELSKVPQLLQSLVELQAYDQMDQMLSDDPKPQQGDTRQRSRSMEYSADQNQRTDPREYRARTLEQYFDTTGLERYLSTCDDCAERSSEPSCPLNLQVLEMGKWATQLQELLGKGCMAAGCDMAGKGRCCVSNKPAFATTVVQMTEMMKDVYNMLLPQCQKCAAAGDDQDDKEDSDAGRPWSTWTECRGSSRTGRSRQRRRPRPCTASSNGRGCMAEELETETCEDEEEEEKEEEKEETDSGTGTEGCCEPGQWSAWSRFGQCSHSCDRGRRMRTRRCNSMRPGAVCEDERRPEMEREVQECPDLPRCRAEDLEDTTPTPTRQDPSECIFRCRDRPAGLYPACNGCGYFISCSGTPQGGNLYLCTDIDGQRAQFDARTKKCVPGRSPTCVLRPGVRNCTNVRDGRYPSTENCNRYVECRGGTLTPRTCPENTEFDYRRQRCASFSTTCVRRMGNRPPVTRPPTAIATSRPGEPLPDTIGVGASDLGFGGPLMGTVIGGVLW